MPSQRGKAAFALAQDVRLDAAKANQILAPRGVTILESAKYYEKHALAYKTATLVKDIVQRYIADSISRDGRANEIENLPVRSKALRKLILQRKSDK